MRPHLPLVLLLASSALISGCVSQRSLSVSDDSRAAYEQGVAVLRSSKTNLVVVRLLSSEFSNETNAMPAFFVAVANGTDNAIDFSTANVTATSGGERVKVYSFEDVQKRIKREAALMAFAVAMNAAGQSMQASMPQTSYSSGSVNAYGTGGYARANYSGYATTYNPAATAAAQAQINANSQNQMAMIAAARNAQLNDTGALLRRNTVAPGNVAGGVVKLHAQDIRSGHPLVLTVTVGPEVHEFKFNVTR